jgi:hypothetical protein
MNEISGFTVDTPKRLILGPGAVYVNYGEAVTERMIGATRGGSTFDPGITYRQIEGDFPQGNLKGLRRVDGVAPVLTVNVLEWTRENIMMAFPGMNFVAGTVGPPDLSDWDVLTMGDLDDTDYWVNVALVATVAGTDIPVVALVKNALGDGGMTISLTNRGEAVSAVTFRGYWDPAAPTSAPIEIRYPKPAP